MSAGEVRQLLGRRTFDSYYKFCFERNPWDKVVSDYFWVNRSGEYRDLDDFFTRYKLKSDFKRYTIDGKPVVDFIGRYEHLLDDLEKVTVRLGIPFDRWLPRAKGGHRDPRAHYRELLSPAQRDLIAERFKREIELMDYEF